MTKTVIFNQDIDHSTVVELIQELDTPLQEDDLVQLYFKSQGGNGDAQQLLSDYLAGWKDNVILIGNCELFSAAFHIFLTFPGEKRILPNTWGMIHLGTNDLDYRMLQDVHSVESLMEKQLIRHNEELGTLYGAFLTKREKQDFQAGKDIYFMPDRMIKLFN